MMENSSSSEEMEVVTVGGEKTISSSSEESVEMDNIGLPTSTVGSAGGMSFENSLAFNIEQFGGRPVLPEFGQAQAIQPSPLAGALQDSTLSTVTSFCCQVCHEELTIKTPANQSTEIFDRNRFLFGTTTSGRFGSGKKTGEHPLGATFDIEIEENQYNPWYNRLVRDIDTGFSVDQETADGGAIAEGESTYIPDESYESDSDAWNPRSFGGNTSVRFLDPESPTQENKNIDHEEKLALAAGSSRPSNLQPESSMANAPQKSDGFYSFKKSSERMTRKKKGKTLVVPTPSKKPRFENSEELFLAVGNVDTSDQQSSAILPDLTGDQVPDKVWPDLILPEPSGSSDSLIENTDTKFSNSERNVAEETGSSCGSPNVSSEEGELDAASQSYSPTGITPPRGCYLIPSLDELESILNNDGTCIVEKFTIGREGYGKVVFEGPLDVGALDLDDIVRISHREVSLYGRNVVKPPVGQGLNREATVTLEGVWPRGKTTGKPITDPDWLKKKGFEGKLRRMSTKMGTEFLSYEPETGSVVFKVSHFSNYEYHSL